MKHEPPIDHTQLAEAVHAAYGIRAATLTFIPVGFAAVCYALTCTSGGRYFLKLWPETRTSSKHADDRKANLRLVQALHARQLLANVPHPLPNRTGQLYATFAGTLFALFPLLAGVEPDFNRSPALWNTFAHTLATLHRATPALADVLPPRERFDFPLEADLRSGLALLERAGSHERAEVRALRRLVLPRLDDVSAQLEKLSRLREAVQKLSGPFVLCHTDAGRQNLLVDTRGELYVLDWDEARVAPPEHDLQEARDGDFTRVLAVYEESGGAGPLHLEHFAFYLLRRHLGDMTVRLSRVLGADATPGQAEDALHGIEAWGFAQWRVLDETLARLARQLR